MAPYPLPDTAGASRRASGGGYGTGPRFPVPAMAGRSASSWRGLLVVPGGSSDAARVPYCDKARGHRTPSRYPRRLMMRPSTDEVMHDRRGLERGDKFPQTNLVIARLDRAIQ
jgi:hypothetical protein